MQRLMGAEAGGTDTRGCQRRQQQGQEQQERRSSSGRAGACVQWHHYRQRMRIEKPKKRSSNDTQSSQDTAQPQHQVDAEASDAEAGGIPQNQATEEGRHGGCTTDRRLCHPAEICLGQPYMQCAWLTNMNAAIQLGSLKVQWLPVP